MSAETNELVFRSLAALAGGALAIPLVLLFRLDTITMWTKLQHELARLDLPCAGTCAEATEAPARPVIARQRRPLIEETVPPPAAVPQSVPAAAAETGVVEPAVLPLFEAAPPLPDPPGWTPWGYIDPRFDYLYGPTSLMPQLEGPQK